MLPNTNGIDTPEARDDLNRAAAVLGLRGAPP
jgi:hypothetical protein